MAGTSADWIGESQRAQFERTEAVADIDDAVETARRALRTTPSGHREYARWLTHLSVALRSRYERTGAVADLDDAVESARAAVRASVAVPPDHTVCLAALANALRIRFERGGPIADLDEAIDTARRAVRLAPADSLGQAAFLNSLGTVLLTRYERTGSTDALHEAVDVLRRAVRATPSSHPKHPVCQHNLCLALRTRFERFGVATDLDDAIDAARRAALAAPTDHPGHAAHLSILSAALRSRFGSAGNTEDLDDAIDVARRAVQFTPPDHRIHSGRLSILSAALRARFERTGDTTDLDDAIEAIRRAVRAAPADDPAQVRMLNNLGLALGIRFDRIGAMADLEEAVDSYRRAAQATPSDHPDLPMSLIHLCIVLCARSERTEAVADIDEAVDSARLATALTPTDKPSHANCLANLGTALLTRFERTGSVSDLDESVESGRGAVRATSADHPDLAGRLCNFGHALLTRFELAGAQSDRDAAVHAFQTAAEVDSATPSVRLHAAHTAGSLVGMSDPARAAGLLELAIRLLPEIATRRLRRPDQLHALTRRSNLAQDAAALTLRDPSLPASERPAKALQLLEAGRAVLLSQALQVRSDITDLADRHPDLAADFLRLRESLDHSTDPAMRKPQDVDGDAAPDRHHLAREFDEVLTRIRALDGFHTFALPPSIEQLRAQADQGPIVVFNISRFGCDAVIVTSDAVTALPLPFLSFDIVAEQTKAFQRALHDVNSDTWASRQAGREQLPRTLEWLWDNATGPVLDALGYRDRLTPGQTGPRVWWIPGGLFGLLPIHAGGYHRDATDPDAKTVMDRIISSYTPTIGALRYARRPAATDPTTASQSALIVAMPTTPGFPDLPAVPEETRLVASHFPDAVTLTEPETRSDTGPTKATVLNLLGDCRIAHFACHGASDATDPSHSRLLLHDHATDPLTVAALTPVQLQHARLAYLSACNTAATAALALLDEAINLAGAFQLAGYPHVVGTLWTIDDRTALRIADDFYAGIKPTPAQTDPDIDRAAQALHHAVRVQRDNRPGEPYWWAAYLHSGA